ncbi:MAG TPA: hypothetical protein VJ840_15830 [Gemmatimonadaceae bacterium]|nr:hypothetical protein [Gemmatimonadaceae bacterium]
MGAPAVAAILRRREQEVIDDFRAAGATSPDRAMSYQAIGLGDSLAIKRLRNRAVIREAAPGTYYLDEEVWSAVVRTRRRLVITVLSIIAMFSLAMLLGIIKW